MELEPVIIKGAGDRWANLHARGAAHDRENRRRLFILAAMLVISAVILRGLWLVGP